MSIPTMVLFKEGNEVDRVVGAIPEEAVKDFASQ
jgi:thioredoxin-like negative regulator of GroEL